MTTTLEPAASAAPARRTPTTRRFLMCPPDHFEVVYAINPWMSLDVPVDRALAQRQWAELRDTYLRLGHRVEVMTPTPGLPDMVFAANAGVVHGDRALVANFTHPQRRPESAGFAAWFEQAGFSPVRVATEHFEGEGDILTVGGMMLAGAGPRTSPAAHRELGAYFGVPVVGLELVDPRFYHLDTALAVLDDRTVAYFPGAFSPASRAVIRRLFPDAVEASEEDACGFGLNAVSDGYNVVLSDRAPALAARLAALGFNPIPVDTGELIKAGGSAKCCTLELPV